MLSGKRNLRILVLLILLCLCCTGCGGQEPANSVNSKKDSAAPYDRPDHWTPAADASVRDWMTFLVTDEALLPFSVPTSVEALQTPVAILIQARGMNGNSVTWRGDCCFTDTDAFETTRDLSKAKTVLAVRVLCTQEQEGQGGQYRVGLKYTCSVTVPGSQYGLPLTAADSFPDQEVRTVETADEYAPLSKAADEAFFTWLASQIRFGPDAGEELTRVLRFFTDENLAATAEADRALLRLALPDCTYPAELDLSENRSLLDTELPILLYAANVRDYPTDSSSGYERPAALLENLPEDPPKFCRQSIEAWAGCLRGERYRLIGFTEQVSVKYLGRYSSIGSIYQQVFRVTILDAETGALIGWYRIPPEACTLPQTCTMDDVLGIGGVYYWRKTATIDPVKLPFDALYRN